MDAISYSSKWWEKWYRNQNYAKNGKRGKRYWISGLES